MYAHAKISALFISKFFYFETKIENLFSKLQTSTKITLR